MKKDLRSVNGKILAGAAIVLVLLLLITRPQRTMAQTNTFPSSGSAGIGTTSPTQALDVNGQVVTTGSQTLTVASKGVIEVTNTITNNAISIAAYRARNTFNGNGTNVAGFDVSPTFAPSASVSLARGMIVGGFFAPPAGVTITDVYGANAVTAYNNVSGAVTNGTTFLLAAPIVSGALKPTTQYGLRILNQGISGTTNSYGLYVDAQSGSTNNYGAIFAGGNIGIGTASPTAILHIQGSGTNNYRGIQVQNTFTDATDKGGIAIIGGRKTNANAPFAGFGTWDQGTYRAAYIGGGQWSIPDANIIKFYTASSYDESNGVSGNQRMLIDSSGKVGIGTTSPSYLLDVAGQIRSGSGGFVFPNATVQTTAATMTGVTAGAGLTGGGTSGTVTLTNNDTGSAQNIFKNVANSSGTTQFSAGSNTDAIRFAGSGGTTVSFDAATKKVTIDGSTSTPSAANISAGQFGQNTGGGNYTFPGNVTVNGNIAAKYQDMAEWVPASEQIPTGTVVVLDVTKSNQVVRSTQAYDTRVAGVVSEQPGIALGESGEGKVLVATTGRVLVNVDATSGPIHIGDLLVTSSVPGMAMKSEPIKVGGRLMHMPGTLIGKALEPLEKGSGKILVLLSLQ